MEYIILLRHKDYILSEKIIAEERFQLIMMSKNIKMIESMIVGHQNKFILELS